MASGNKAETSQGLFANDKSGEYDGRYNNIHTCDLDLASRLQIDNLGNPYSSILMIVQKNFHFFCGDLVLSSRLILGFVRNAWLANEIKRNVQLYTLSGFRVKFRFNY